ncbi:MAG TPA: hypothetical protein VNE41_08055 [Chitinophagaceae bacterium]|nr:hypothetical protein [Chitinophagaceae bacterium]
MSKRIFSLLAVIFIAANARAQTEADALRYSESTTGGTARTQAIGGAAGSLGGDITSLSVNPAGIGLYKTNEFVITPGLLSANNGSTYLGNTASVSKDNVYFSNLGIVFASDRHRGSGSKWQNVTVGLSINRMANYNSHIYYTGTNNQTSYSDNYLLQLQGQTSITGAEQNYPYGASEAVNTGLIGPVVDSSNQPTGNWESIVPVSTGIKQENSISTSGGLNEFSLGVAGNYDNRFFLGGSLNVPSIKYHSVETFQETNINNSSSPLNYYNVTNYLSTDGIGINGKLGIIYKINDAFRFGLAFHTPSIYSMNDTYSTSLTTNSKDQGTLTNSTQDIQNGYPGQYSYGLTTPWRGIVSATYIFGTSPDVNKQHGFITADYEYVNYADASYHFSGTDASLSDALNASIRNLYKAASDFRIGAEMKFDIFSIRAGFAYYSSPYRDPGTDGTRMLYSGGIGYRNKGIYVDATYIYSNVNNIDQPYLIPQNSSGLNSPPAARISTTSGNMVMSFGFLF